MRTIIVGISILFLSLSAVFGFLNHAKVGELRSETAAANSARESAERLRLASAREAKTHNPAGPAENKSADGQRAAELEAALKKTQAEKDELQSRVEADEARLGQLPQQTQHEPTLVPSPPAASGELQTQVEDMRRQLDSAEKEKALLMDKLKSQPDRPVVAEQPPPKKRLTTRSNAGVRGTVLAVNQAYNFVVLNLGARSGVEVNSEMLVLRGGSSIGKIVVSSVEPATAIGDIVTNSLARGVQVQPGDTVIYAGSSTSPP